jgi:endonuclease/exonuclease/phosphatase (EEP) superfamily protein YafD
MKAWLRRFSAAVAIAYVAGLLVVSLMLRFVGEHWWLTGVGLYLPRAVFLLPLPFAVLLLAVFGPRKLLYTQLAALLYVVFVMMSFTVSLPSRRAGTTVRVMSFNVNSGYFGVDGIIDAIAAHSPDIVLCQELMENREQLRDGLARHFPTVQLSTQFLLGTKLPVVATLEPEKLLHDGRERSPRFIRYTIRTSLGEVAVYNVHPISPRYGIYAIRGAGLRKELLSGRFFKAENTGQMQSDSELRELQVRAFARMATASAEHGPVIIAGDTNLPTLSPVLAENLSPFVDGFRSVGFGFGYTFPARRPWMRIDRILTTHDLRFETFTVDCQQASDHHCVIADIGRR